MGDPRRIQKPDAMYLVTNRTIDDQPFMQPSRRVNEIIRNNLAWAAARRNIELYVYGFLPNCFFMLVAAPELNLGRFMGDFQGLTATQINKELNRNGSFFDGSYDDSHVLDEGAIMDQLRCILSVHAAEYATLDGPKPVSSWPLHQSGEPLVGEREDRELYRNIKRSNPGISDDEARRLATTTYTVELAKFSFWEDEAHMNYHRKVCEHVRLSSTRTGLALIEGTEESYVHRPYDRPLRRLPRCITTIPSRGEAFKKWVDDLNFRYATASAALRRGRGNLEFPHGMIPPHRPWAVGATPTALGRVGRARTHPVTGRGPLETRGEAA